MTTEAKGQAVSHRIEDVRDDLVQLRDDVQSLGQTVVKRGTASVHDLEKRAKKSLIAARDFVEERPMTTLAVTFGAGLLVGLLLCRRR